MRRSVRNKIIFGILISVKGGNKNLTFESYSIDEKTFFEISEDIKTMGYLEDVLLKPDFEVDYSLSSITEKGEDFIKNQLEKEDEAFYKEHYWK